MANKTLLPLKHEYVFVLLAAIFGLLMVFTNPPFHSNDEDRHFIHSYLMSEGLIINDQQDGKVGGPVPVNLVKMVKSYQGIRFDDDTKILPEKFERQQKERLNPNSTEFYHNYHYRENPVPYIPHALGIAIGGAIDDNPIWLGWFGRIGGLICYIILMVIVIRITPIFKSVFMLYGLTPMVLFQSASVSYDMLSNTLSFMLVALFLYYAFDKDYKLCLRDFVLIIVLVILHRFAKQGYVFIPFVFLIIPRERIGEKAKGWAITAAFMVFFVLAYNYAHLLWQPFVSGLSAKSMPALMKAYSGMNTLGSIMDDPFRYIDIAVTNILYQRHDWVAGTIGRFGYSYTLLPDLALILHGLALLFVSFFDCRADIVIRPWQKVLLFLIGTGTIAAIITGSYITMTPMGGELIFGLQGRYFIPAVPVLLLLLYNNKFVLPKWNRYKSIIIGVYLAAFLAYTISFMNNTYYH